MKSIFFKGITLVETIVSIGILSLVMFGVTLYFTHIWPLQQFAIESTQAQIGASESVTDLVKAIRTMRQSDAGEYPLQSVGESEIIFFSDYDGDGQVERVRFFLDGTNIIVGIIRPVGVPAVYAGSQETTTIFVENVRNGTGSYPSTLFHYYSESNQELSIGGFSKSQVRMVGVDIYIDINPSASPDPVHFESFASIRNLTEHDRLQ